MTFDDIFADISQLVQIDILDTFGLDCIRDVKQSIRTMKIFMLVVIIWT